VALRRHGPPDTSRYEGFKGAYDKFAGTYIFESMEERDRFQREKYGAVRNGYRKEDEPTDERPLLIYPEPVWESAAEMNAWLRAVQSCPLLEYGHLDAFVYLAEVGKVSGGIRPVKSMPRPGLTRRQMDQRLRTLRGQASTLAETSTKDPGGER
jgi:hypothetical protein